MAASVSTGNDQSFPTNKLIERSSVRTVSSKPSLGSQLLTAGVAACLADLVTFPLDTLKVRLQVQGEVSAVGRGVAPGLISTVVSVTRNEGVRALYSGIVPGLQRQMAFSAIRIGAYDTVKQSYMETTGVGEGDGIKMMGVRILAGVTTGTLAILAAQPTDVVKVRMQAAGKNYCRYRGVMHAYSTIARREGFINGLYKGTCPNIARNCIVNIGETVVYDSVKNGLISNGLMVDGVKCHLSSAVVAGVTATLVASPVDVVKTRYMNSAKGQYRGALHCARQTAVKEGFSAFYKGFQVSCMRLVSWNICLWLSYEQLKCFSKSHRRN